MVSVPAIPGSGQTKVPAPEVSAPKVSAPKIDDGGWQTVVVVEPDPEARTRLVRILREASGEAKDPSRRLAIHEAANGNVAWTLVETVKPDLVVSEILLEGLSGMQLLRRLGERYEKDAPRMLFVTQMSNEVDRYWALRNGAAAFVIKPYEDEFLRDRSTKLLNKVDISPEGTWRSDI